MSQKASSGKAVRVNKVRALVARAGTPGEQAAAEAALERIKAIGPTLKRRPFSENDVKRLPIPERGNRVHFDVKPGGFGVRVTAAGSRSFIFDYRVRGSGQQRRITIGAVGNWSIGAARAEAKRLRQIVDGGGDPLGDFEEQREAPTMAELCDRFEREHLQRKRASTAKDYRGMLSKHVRPFFGKHTRVDDVGYADIDKLHRKITASGSTYVANRCVAMLSKMFSLAIKWQMRDDNPCRGIERNPEAKRKRYLTGDELKRLTAALAETPDKQFVNIVMLLILTGARCGEVFSMRWSDLTLTKDKGVWSKLGSTTKQKTDHIVPLSAAACQVLGKIKRQGEFVFPSSDNPTGHIVAIRNGFNALCERARIVDLRVHDLRHSFASQLVSSGASLPLIGSLLGHSNPSTTARYAHLFDDPQREAVEKLGRIVGGGA